MSRKAHPQKPHVGKEMKWTRRGTRIFNEHGEQVRHMKSISQAKRIMRTGRSGNPVAVYKPSQAHKYFIRRANAAKKLGEIRTSLLMIGASL